MQSPRFLSRKNLALMGYHSFSLDPRTVLGVGHTASQDEIHEAYHAKSKKHHPDLGGDEWAFRMVVRAYEVLKTTTSSPAPRPWESNGANHVLPETQVRLGLDGEQFFWRSRRCVVERNDFAEASASDMAAPIRTTRKVRFQRPGY